MDTNTLANALKSVFGNNTTDNPSSSSKIPYCGSDGLPAGLASMGNLASVLGDLTPPTSDLTAADVNESGYRNLTLYFKNGCSNLPEGKASMIWSRGDHDGNVFKIAVSHDGHLYVKGCSSGWVEK